MTAAQDGSIILARWRQCAPRYSTLQSVSAPYRFCPLLSRFEFINCAVMSGNVLGWPISPSKLPVHVWGSRLQSTALRVMKFMNIKTNGYKIWQPVVRDANLVQCKLCLIKLYTLCTKKNVHLFIFEITLSKINRF